MTENYITYEETKKFISEKEKNKTRILGLERFITEGTMIKPDLDGIADFSGVDIDTSFMLSHDFLSIYGKNKKERFVVVIPEI